MCAIGEAVSLCACERASERASACLGQIDKSARVAGKRGRSGAGDEVSKFDELCLGFW